MKKNPIKKFGEKLKSLKYFYFQDQLFFKLGGFLPSVGLVGELERIPLRQLGLNDF